MSWLNLNDSLNSLKGQISSFASGVLADGIVNDTDPFTELSEANQKIQELQNLCASQDIEITSLRRQNADFYEKLSTKANTGNTTTSNVENGDSWFWDPPTSETTKNASQLTTSQSNGVSFSDNLLHPSTEDTIVNLTTKITQLELQNEELQKLTRIDSQKNGANIGPPAVENQKLNEKIAALEQENKDLIQNLEQLDQDCQSTTDKLVTLKDDLQSQLNKLKSENETLKKENFNILEERNNLENNLKIRNSDFDKLRVLSLSFENEIELLKNAQNSIQKSEKPNNFENEYVALQKKFDTLVTEKNNLIQKLISNDQVLSEIQKDHDNLKLQFEQHILESISLEKYKKLQSDFENLQNKFTELELKNKNDQEKIYQLNNDFKEMKLNDKTNLQINLSDDHKKLQDMYDELKLKYDSVFQERKEMHKKYVGILTENVKKYVDHQLPDDFIQKPNENSLYSEFNSKVESTLKLLLDFKWKTETLERKLCEISHEKSVAIAEKNHEIEKLLHNSEILSQEVITKTQTIKDYEIECTELIKNNDLLISELQQYKNNNGLQTISESNEDNLLLMETQLENANKRIRELELIIGDMENAKQDIALETQTELDYIKKQLNMTGKELSQSKKEYQELLKNFNQYELENKNLSAEIRRIQFEYEKCLEEKQSYVSHLEKTQNEMENIEYKYTESNIERESLCQEVWSAKEELTSCIATSTKLNTANAALEKKIVELRNELKHNKSISESSVEVQNNLEHQSRNLIEKIKSLELSETEVKLQNDSLNKKLEALSETKTILEEKYYTLEKEINNIKLVLQSFGLDCNNITIIESITALRNNFILLKEEVKEKNSKNVNQYEEEKIQLYKFNEELLVSKKNLEDKIIEYENQIQLYATELMEHKNKLQQEETNKADLESKYLEKRDIVSKLDTHNFELSSKLTQLETELANLHSSKTELVNLVTVKHQENIQYHAEIQRLNHIIATEAEKFKALELQLQTVDNSNILAEKDSEIDKLADQITFLKDKCEKMAQSLLEEQSNTQKILSDRQIILDREQVLSKELERLRIHLVEIEDTYTQELLQAEQRNKEMHNKMNEVEQRERDSSTIYTSVSIRANQQVETLQNQLQLVTAQRDELQNKISDAEDKNNKQFAALTNLQCVLEQFQRDKEIDITNETERIRRQIKYEKAVQNQLQQEINTLKSQLQESKQGLIAASRLSEQLEKSKQQILTMKDEVTTFQEQLRKTEDKYNTLLNQADGKVDKALIRNLVVGFVGANNNLSKDQSQILKIISTVLDFSQQDNEKLKLNKPQPGSWLNAILHPQVLNAGATISQQSLSEAFVRFLETESQPKVKTGVPTLLDVTRSRKTSEASNSSKQGALLLNEVVLPTFADFAQSRSSSAILKDVLKDNN